MSSANVGDIKAIVMDIDGVLTDGRVGYGPDAEEIKFFHVRDGMAIALALRSGLKVGAISGRASRANRVRAEELKLSFIREGIKRKGEALAETLAEFGLRPQQCLYIGDDLIDIPAMKRAGIAAVPADAAMELGSVEHYRAKAPGGRGAVREIIEWLLKQQGLWEPIVDSYMAE